MSLGKRVKEYRVNNNMDQKEFAEKIDVTQPYLSHLESEKVEPSERLKNRILKIIENGTQEEEQVERYSCDCCRIIKFGDIKELKRVADWKEE